MMTEAIVLAGGLGTRLRSAVPELPKCMASVAGRPFIAYVIDYFQQQGVRRFIFSVGYKHEIIEEFLRKEYSDLQYTCSVEDAPLGTGGAILKSCTLATSSNVLVLNGDTFFRIDALRLSACHEQQEAECTLCLKKMENTDRYGVVQTDESGKITSFLEKKYYEVSVINGGVYALNLPLFMQETFPEKFSFEKDYFEKYYAEKKIYGQLHDGYFIDIGIPEDYARAQTDFKKF